MGNNASAAPVTQLTLSPNPALKPQPHVQEDVGILGAGISVIKSTLTRLVPGVAGHAEDSDDASAGARAAWARVDAAKKEVAAAEAAAEEAREQYAEMQQQADEARCDLLGPLLSSSMPRRSSRPWRHNATCFSPLSNSMCALQRPIGCQCLRPAITAPT